MKKQKLQPGVKLRRKEKLARIPIKVVATTEPIRKPPWIRVKVPNQGTMYQVKELLRKQKLHTVCEEASCPNLPECFSRGTATFMIMGDICTRRCPFCDVAHGRPNPLDPKEPEHLAQAVMALDLKYVVVTSVDRDDLLDGGATHFAACITALRSAAPKVKVEILVPDFRGRMDVAIKILKQTRPDVFNHNLETVSRLYPAVRPGSDYQWSLSLLQQYKNTAPEIPTKSGIMLGLGESTQEVKQLLREMRLAQVDMVTLGQYLQPSADHLPVVEYIDPKIFDELAVYAKELGFGSVASGPLVRSSYHADQQAQHFHK